MTCRTSRAYTHPIGERVLGEAWGSGGGGGGGGVGVW